MAQDRPYAPRPRHLTRLLVALIAMAFLGLAVAGADAHASLVSATPADGTVVAVAPKELTLTFSEPVSPLVLSLIRPDGSRQVLTQFALHDQTLVITVPDSLARGTHVLAWRVVSEDGHPVGGSVLFSIGSVSTIPREAVDTIDWSLRAAIWTGKVLLYLGLFFGAGGIIATRCLVRGNHPQSGFLALAVLGAVAATASIGLQGLDALGAPLSNLAEITIWKAGWSTSFGPSAALAAATCALSLLIAVSTPALGAGLAFIGLAGAGVALAASGHASAATPQWLTRSMVFLHAGTVTLWIGALIPLGLLLKAGGPAAAVALRRFSTFIPFAVAGLVVSGGVLAVIQVQTPAALIDTAYGRVLLVKLSLLVVLFGLAALNRWKLTRPVASGDHAATALMVRSIATETGVAMLIFAAVACWRFTPPPRALAIAAAQPAAAHVHTEKGMADLSLSPGRAGPVAATIVIMTGDFGPLDAKEVTLLLANPEAGIEPLRWKAHKPGDGTWRVDDLVVPAAGSWTYRLDILISDFEMLKLSGKIDVRP